jgi:hypothetical protein
MTESEINTLIESKLEPLRLQIRVLQEKLGIAPVEEVISNEVEIPDNLESSAVPEIVPERSDFQKFLQRGLEQEKLEYTEEKLEAKPAPKKGWNPFKR